jgi:hypothetical protein
VTLKKGVIEGQRIQMVFKNQWWAITPTEPFWGLALGWRDYTDIKIRETATELVVADCTHRYFVFPTYFGADREKVKDTINHNLMELREHSIKDFSLVWLRAKNHPITDELELSHKLCFYTTVNNEANAELLMDVEDLEDLLDTRKHRYAGEGLRWEMPTFASFTEKLDRLEEMCKREFGET